MKEQHLLCHLHQMMILIHLFLLLLHLQILRLLGVLQVLKKEEGQKLDVDDTMVDAVEEKQHEVEVFYCYFRYILTLSILHYFIFFLILMFFFHVRILFVHQLLLISMKPLKIENYKHY